MSRAHPQPLLRRALPTTPPFRLDVLPNPFGPSVHVHDALASADDLHLPAGPLETRLHLRLAALHLVGPDWLTIANGIDELLGMILLWRREAGPLAIFPPTAPEPACLAALHGLETFAWRRSAWFTVDVESNQIRDFPRRATAYVQSPNDPTGTLLGNQDLASGGGELRSVARVVVHPQYPQHGFSTIGSGYDLALLQLRTPSGQLPMSLLEVLPAGWTWGAPGPDGSCAPSACGLAAGWGLTAQRPTPKLTIADRSRKAP